MLDFDKLFLVKDSEYGTHVTYINNYPYFVIDFFSDNDDLENIIEDIKYYLVIEKNKKKTK